MQKLRWEKTFKHVKCLFSIYYYYFSKISKICVAVWIFAPLKYSIRHVLIYDLENFLFFRADITTGSSSFTGILINHPLIVGNNVHHSLYVIVFICIIEEG